MRAWILAALVATFAGVTPAASAQQVSLTLDDGYVTISAQDATLRQILAEWARVGQTRVVNAERIPGTPVTLQLLRVPESEALDVLLRSVSGYMAAPRATALPNASRFDRILVMPPSTPPRVAPTPQPQAFQAPTMPEDFDVEDPAAQGGPPVPPGRGGPVFPQFPATGQAPPGSPYPQPQQMNAPPFPQASPFPQPVAPSPGFTPPTAAPGGLPVGVSTPGMMVAPPQPVQPAAPNAPPQ